MSFKSQSQVKYMFGKPSKKELVSKTADIKALPKKDKKKKYRMSDGGSMKA